MGVMAVYIIGLILSVYLFFRILRVRKSRLGIYLLIMVALITNWIFLEGISYLFTDRSILIFLQKLKYISIITVSPVMLLMSLVFTFRRPFKKRWFVIGFFVIPVLSFLSLATNCFPYPFVTSVNSYNTDGIVFYFYNKEIGFYIHMYYSYFAVLLSNIALAYRFVKSPKIYKNQSFIIMAASIISTGINVLFLMGLTNGIRFDITPFSILVSIFAFYWGIYILPSNTVMNEAKGLMVENLADMTIILDNQENVLDINDATLKAIENYQSQLTDGKVSIGDGFNMPYENLLNLLPLSEDDLTILLDHNDGSLCMVLNDKKHYFDYHRKIIRDANNKGIGELVILHDITESRSYMKKLEAINKTLIISDTIIRYAREAIMVLDDEMKIINVNQSVIETSGYGEKELVGNYYNKFRSDQHDVLFYRKIWNSVTSNGFWEGELWDERKNGEVYPKWMSFTAISDEEGVIQHYVVISSDRTKLKKAETDLKHLAYYDGLTSLPNRTLFMDRMKVALDRAKRNQVNLALLFIDVDRFKEINDSLGHSMGDKLLIAIAERIKLSIDENDTLCRLGGDEFTLILEEVSDAFYAENIAKKIIKSFEEPLIIDALELKIMVSIGIAIGPEEDETEERLISRADIAMYQSKESKGKKYNFISDEILKKRKRLHQINMELNNALKDGEFQLYFQPQIKIVDDQPVLAGAEALIRWFKADGTMISPNEFIEVAEANGVIHEMGLWVFREAFRINRLLREKGITINLSINVSVIQFERSDFIPKVIKIMENNDVPIDLNIEITESLFFTDLEKGISNLKKLKSLGFTIALDDFGTGFSSLSYLNQLPVDYLKIDKSFIDEIVDESKESMAFLILSMSKTLHMTSVAEGVETELQAKSITEAGCDIIQGYFYSKPLNLEGFMDYALSMQEKKSLQ